MKPLQGKLVAMTGTLSIPRADFAILIEDAGGVAVTSLSKSTDILIVGAEPGEGKLDKARANGTAIWDEGKARDVMDGKTKGLFTVKVFGTSDDIVSLVGAVSEELNGGDEDTFVRFTNGTYVALAYNPEGIWRARVIEVGRAKVRKLYGVPEEDGQQSDQHHNDPDAPTYSDVLIIESEEPMELESWGHKPLSAPRAGVRVAKEIVGMLEGRKGFDHWWHDIDQDDKTEILEEIAGLVEGKG